MTSRRASVALFALLVVVACTSPVPLTPSPSPTPPTSPAAGGLHAFPALEARLPDEVVGHRLTKVSLAAHADRQDAKTLEVLRRLNRTAADIQLASGAADGVDLLVAAMRIIGSEGAVTAATFRAVEEDDAGSSAVYASAEIGNKSVTTRTTATQVSYIYAVEDIMFIVSGNQALVAEALVLLP